MLTVTGFQNYFTDTQQCAIKRLLQIQSHLKCLVKHYHYISFWVQHLQGRVATHLKCGGMQWLKCKIWSPETECS